MYQIRKAINNNSAKKLYEVNVNSFLKHTVVQTPDTVISLKQNLFTKT